MGITFSQLGIWVPVIGATVLVIGILTYRLVTNSIKKSEGSVKDDAQEISNKDQTSPERTKTLKPENFFRKWTGKEKWSSTFGVVVLLVLTILVTAAIASHKPNSVSKGAALLNRSVVVITSKWTGDWRDLQMYRISKFGATAIGHAQGYDFQKNVIWKMKLDLHGNEFTPCIQGWERYYGEPLCGSSSEYLVFRSEKDNPINMQATIFPDYHCTSNGLLFEKDSVTTAQ